MSWLHESTHGLDKFNVDKNGNILTRDGKIATKSDDVKDNVIRGIQSTLLGMNRSQMTSVFKFQSCEAEIITAGMEELAVFASQEFEDHARDAYTHTKNLYDNAIYSPKNTIACLSASEIRETLAEAVITQTSYVDTVEKHFKHAMQTARSIAEDFNTLHQKMIDASQRITQEDLILAGIIPEENAQLPHTQPSSVRFNTTLTPNIPQEFRAQTEKK